MPCGRLAILQQAPSAETGTVGASVSAANFNENV